MKQISRHREHRVPNRISPKKPIPRLTIIKKAKIKENSKGSKRKTKSKCVCVLVT